ncbi:MAG: insulinase family protein [Alphaproteobacteria bacterium]|nr:insulinase family protein [Alphaproteobacteria bacterium]
MRVLLVALIALVWSWTGPARAVDIERVVSPGGIEAWLVRDATLPLLALEFRFRGGTAGEPVERAGVGQLAIEMLREGAGDLDSSAFAAELEERSIALSFSASSDQIAGGLRVLNMNRARGIELLALALTRPRLDPTSVERVRARLLAGYSREAEEPRAMARRAFQSTAFPDHPYGRSLEATVAGTRAATIDDLRGFIAARLARDNLIVGVVGDVTAAELGPLLDQAFGGLPAKASPTPVAEVAPAIAAERTIVIRRRIPQSVQMFGAPGLKRDDPDWFAGQLVNYVLGGGGFNSRLMTEVREKRGLTYGVSTGLSALDHSAVIFGASSTENARAARALEIIRAEWRRMAEEGPTADELENAKAFLTGSFALSLDSSASVARLLTAIQYDRLGIDYLARRDALIRGVTLEDARRVARRLYGGAGFLTVIVGEPEGIASSGG